MKDREMKEAKEEKLFEAATKLFGAHGYSDTTIENIAEEAGSSKGAIYYYYDSKEELFQDLLRSWLERFKEGWEALEGDDSPVEKLRSLHSNMMPMLGESAALSKLMMEFWAHANRKEEIEDVLTDWYMEYRQKTASVIKTGVEQGVFHDVDPWRASLVLVAAYDGLWFHWILSPESFPIEEAGKEFINIFIRGLLVKKPQSV